LGIVDKPEAATNVRNGKVRAFSWIGHPTSWENLDGGGRRFSKVGAINPLLETTITAYPINTTAIMRVAKAHGYDVEPSKPEESKQSTSKVYSIPTQALIDLVMNSERVQQISQAAVDHAFAKKDK
jgi:hypothetical protein